MPDTAVAQSRTSTGASRLGVRLAGACVAASVVLHSPGYVRRLFDPDEAAIAVQGMAMVRGGHLYTDVIDRKPPLAPWVYATSFRITGTHDLRPVRLFVAVAVGLAAALVAWDLLRNHGRRAAWWGAGLFVAGAVAFAPQDAQSANFSPMALLPGAGAMVAARWGTRRSAALAGVLVGIATLTRQSWAVAVIPAMVSAWCRCEGREPAVLPVAGRRLRERAAGLPEAVRAGGLEPLLHAGLVVVLALGTVAAVGLTVPLRLFITWVFTGNGSLLLGISESSDAALRAFGSFMLFLVGHLVIAALLVVRAVAPRRGDVRRDGDVWLWVASGLLSVVAGFRFFGHYWMQALPPLCLLAAPAVEQVPALARRAMAGVVAVTAAVFGLLSFFPMWTHRLPDPDPLVAFVRAHSEPSDKVAIWGSYPEVYWLADRMPAGGLVHTDFVVGKSAGRVESAATLRDADPEVVRDYVGALEAAPPELFIDTSPSGLRDYGAYPVKVLPELAALLHRRYRRIAVIDRMVVYERIGPRPPTPEWLRD